uniref:ATP synthetase subunit 6 n=1 Tax=Dracunculus medinensis TaxID=318479 RepID=G3LUH0_DRAME|nr:ATP synthase F0 subunit 6 [Dracunculus medinensis]AEO27236.1 ATP synthetase subunit 6 [Dracunculus medinensis]
MLSGFLNFSWFNYRLLVFFSLYFLLFFFVVLFFIQEFGGFYEFFNGLGVGFCNYLFGGGDSYFVKFLLVFVVLVMSFSFYHYLSYTEDVWCNVVFSGSLSMVGLLVSFLVWLMRVRVHWNYVSSSLEVVGLSWWGFLSGVYHHVSTPVVMLLRVYMNFLIGQGGKWALLVMGFGSSFLLFGFSYFLFFFMS